MLTRGSRRRLRAVPVALVAIALGAAIPAGPVGGQSGARGYDFYSLRAIGDGVTVDFNLIGFLPIEDLVGLSSITSEARYGVSRSDALAALPDPGDLILTLPGTLSALLGISGVPDYPAAAQADYVNKPVDDVELVPDAGLGAGHLHTAASEDGSEAEAFVGRQVDTIGLLPSFSVGTIRTTATTRRINPSTLEGVATTAVSDVVLLGGLVRIDQITSEVRASVANDTVTASATKVDVSGATIAGTPVGITSDGIVGLGQQVALAPVIDALVQPLLERGISIRTTPVEEEIGDRTAHASGGALQIEVPIAVQGYPGTLSVTFGKATAAIEVGPLGDGDGLASDGPSGSGVDLGSTPLPGLGSTPSFGTDLPASRTPGSSDDGTITELVAVPVGREVPDWDVTTLYRILLLGGGALALAGHLVVRTSNRPHRRSTDLRQLWRW